MVTFAFLRESYAPVLLERKAARLAQQTGNQALHSGLEKGTAAEKFRRAIVRPLKLLLMTPIVTLMALYVALAYGITYLLYTTFSFVYSEKYGFSEGIAGLTFLPAGLGMMIGVLAFGHLSDAMVKKRQARGIEHVAELRLTPLMAVPSALLLPAGLFIYGWATDYAIHWIVPMVGVFLYTFGLMGVMVNTLSHSFRLFHVVVMVRWTNKLTRNGADVYPELSPRLLPALCRLLHCSDHRAPLHRRGASPTRGVADV